MAAAVVARRQGRWPSICSARCGRSASKAARRGASSRTATTRACRRGRPTAGGWPSRPTYRDTWHIWIANADGTGLQEVTSGPFDDREPHWSPDGTRLAFSSDRGGNYDIWIVTVATGEVRRLTTNAANDSMPAWSPDGREIAFVSDRAERGVYARAVDGGRRAAGRGRRDDPVHALVDAGRQDRRLRVGERRRQPAEGRRHARQRRRRGRVSLPAAVGGRERAALHRGRRDQAPAARRWSGPHGAVHRGGRLHAACLHAEAARLLAARARSRSAA